jgi:glycosyltransferase involved in cell wall biosynthesis
MNVLMFGWEFPPHISGGLGTACYGIVKGLSNFQDVNISFVVPKAHGNERTSENLKLISAENVSEENRLLNLKKSEYLQYIEVASNLSPYLTPEGFASSVQLTREQKEEQELKINRNKPKIYFSGTYGPSLFDEINNYALVAKTIASNSDFEVIHAHDWLTFPAAIAAKQISGKPLVVHIHSTDFDRSGGSVNPKIYQIEKQGMEEADHIITVSNLIKRRLTDQYQIPENKITTIYNAVEPQKKEPGHIRQKKSKEKIVTFLGRLTIQKGPEYFVDVARMIINRMKNVHFVIAGNGEMREKIISRCIHYGISHRVHFTGFLNGPEVDEMYRRSDLFIMPSVSEPFGIVPLEAMLSEVPVIISLQSGVSELIKNVVKTDFWDVHAMADAVYGILKRKRLSATLIAEGKKEVNQLNWKHSAGEIRQIYLQTIVNKAS